MLRHNKTLNKKGLNSYQLCPLNIVKLENNTFCETDKYVEVKQHTPTMNKGSKNPKRKYKIQLTLERSINWHNFSEIDQGRIKIQIIKCRNIEGKITTNFREINAIVKEYHGVN